MRNSLNALVEAKRAGKPAGIASYCTAEELALEACLQHGAKTGGPVLIEATANQINQFGGYTGMRPADYRDYVLRIADRTFFPRERLILGGDHLGPLAWASEPEETAMEKAEELVRLFVLAGFTKIHLDTSMRLASDDPLLPLSDETVARRGARLLRVCRDAFSELASDCPDAVEPVYIIGSEVPVPGGATENGGKVSVTSPKALRRTVETYRDVFRGEGLGGALDSVIGLVVQPGVEFGDDGYSEYDRKKAATLMTAAGKYDSLVLEGHSTDYQPPQALRRMVEDGVAILKVGPALTFAVREGLFALDMMERELLPAGASANFADTLERVMLADPGKWEKYYHGGDLRLKRRYSFSDRSRYYFACPELRDAMDRLMLNIDRTGIPLGLLHQYMPIQYKKAAAGELAVSARELIKDVVCGVADDYDYAIHSGRSDEAAEKREQRKEDDQ